MKFDAAAFDALDAEVASVFADKQLITPDQVQGKHKTLRAAVLADGWPKLRDARGRVFFVLDEAPAKVAIYRGKSGARSKAVGCSSTWKSLPLPRRTSR